jgi:hypothetical protein
VEWGNGVENDENADNISMPEAICGCLMMDFGGTYNRGINLRYEIIRMRLWPLKLPKANESQF